MTAITGDDLTVRTSTNKATANTWISHDDMVEIVKFRFDKLAWDAATVDQQCTAMAMAYHDIDRLAWSSTPGLNQSRDYEFGARFVSEPPLDDPDFEAAIGRAQCAQALFILQGTQVREMGRAGIRMHRALTGAEMEFMGYKGAVCSEALEILSEFIESQPRFRRMR